METLARKGLNQKLKHYINNIGNHWMHILTENAHYESYFLTLEFSTLLFHF